MGARSHPTVEVASSRRKAVGRVGLGTLERKTPGGGGAVEEERGERGECDERIGSGGGSWPYEKRSVRRGCFRFPKKVYSCLGFHERK